MKINIKGHLWDVEKVKEIPKDSNAVGATQQLDKKIYLMQADYAKEVSQETFATIIHELTHAYFYETGMRNLKEYEENFCYWLEACYLEILSNAIEIANKLFGISFTFPDFKKKKVKHAKQR